MLYDDIITEDLCFREFIMKEKKSRSNFSSKLGFVLSAAGSAVGLGNIWRFPYLAAKYGGGIFLLVYLILVVTFGYTMIVAESALGRMTHKSPVGAYRLYIQWNSCRELVSDIYTYHHTHFVHGGSKWY